MSFGIAFTERDARILVFLKEQGVATLDQIEKLFFVSNDSARRRISLLCRAGLIESVLLSRGLSLVPSRGLELKKYYQSIGVQWQKVRLYRLTKDLSGTEEQFNSALSEPIFWQHQLGLNEVRVILSSILPKGVFLSDPETKSEWSRFKMGEEVPIPDLVWRGEKKELAFEYERTNKGEMRYFHRFSKYERSSYAKILYIANSTDIFEQLRKIAMRFPKIGVTERSNLSKVFVGQSGYISISSFLEA